MLASRNKATDLNLAKSYFGLKPWVKQKIPWQVITQQNLNIKPNQCPACNKNSMIVFEVIDPLRGPPNKAIKPNYDF